MSVQKLPSSRPVLRRLAAVVAAGFVTAIGAGSAADVQAATCGLNSARTAFDVQGLKSELMVTALSCNQQERYNGFVARFRADLLDQEAVLNRYFKTAYGRSAQKEHDDYITQLANVQSDKGLTAGTAFCDQRMAMFDEVAMLNGAADLSGYVEAKDIVQPASYETCAAPEIPSRSVRVRRINSVGHRASGHRSSRA